MKRDNLKNNSDRLEYLNEKHNEIKEDQEKNLLIDFDQAIADNGDIIRVKFLNREYQLPADIPFSFNTFFLRHCMKKVKGKTLVEIPDERIVEFLEHMFGKEFLNALNNCKNSKVTTKLVFDTLVPPILKEWGYDINNKNNPEVEKKIYK